MIRIGGRVGLGTGVRIRGWIVLPSGTSGSSGLLLSP